MPTVLAPADNVIPVGSPPFYRAVRDILTPKSPLARRCIEKLLHLILPLRLARTAFYNISSGVVPRIVP